MHRGVAVMNVWMGRAFSDRRSDVRSLFIRIFALPIVLAMLAGCAVNERLPAVPLAAERHVDILGISDARFYADDARKLEQYARKLIARRDQNKNINRVEHYLAISGGADDGAFGAGLLLGWSARGDRPSFEIVTGVSTGALTAPFAFLGKDYDNALKDIYTSVTASDIFTMRPLIYAALMSDGLADSTPLRNLISHYLDQRMMRRLAEEFGKGRILLIGTTNLDQSQGVIWNIGAIAASRHPKARELIIDVLTASASVPGVFPPVMLDVTVNGVPHQEMHVDGGTIAQTFLYPPTLSLSRLDAEAGVRRNRVAYVIRNGRLTPPETTVERSTLPIAAKTLATMIATSGVNDSIKSTWQQSAIMLPSISRTSTMILMSPTLDRSSPSTCKSCTTTVIRRRETAIAGLTNPLISPTRAGSILKPIRSNLIGNELAVAACSADQAFGLCTCCAERRTKRAE